MKYIEEEIPFEIPSGWCWARLNTIIDVRDGTHDTPKYVDEGVPLFTSKNLSPIGLDYSNVKYISYEDAKSINERSGVDKGDILYAMIGTIGNPTIVDSDIEMSIKNVALFKFSYSQNLSNRYMLYFFSYAQEYMKKDAAGGLQPFVSLTYLRNYLVPVPPVAEQARICAKCDLLAKNLLLIDEDKAELSDTVERAKSKILDLAIRGKLVPQDSNDEPASILLERIRAKKEELIKQGKLKRDKKESIIFKGDDNSYYEKFSDNTIININNDIPFDIPETWCWSRLSSICIKEIKRGKAPKYKEQSSTLVFAQKCNLKKGGIDYSLAQYLDDSKLSKYDDSEFIRVGDIVINSTGKGTLGRVGFIDSLVAKPIVPDSHVTIVRSNDEIASFYIFVLLKSLQPYLEKSGEGSTNQKELKPHTIQDIYVPIPPIEEQKKICEVVRNSFSLLKNIEGSIT